MNQKREMGELGMRLIQNQHLKKCHEINLQSSDHLWLFHRYELSYFEKHQLCFCSNYAL